VASRHKIYYQHHRKHNLADRPLVDSWSVQDSSADIFDRSKHIFNLLSSDKFP
jgi:hypothetical protein